MTGKREEMSVADFLNWIVGMRKIGAFDKSSLDRIKQRFDLGDRRALLDAVYACILRYPTDPLPEWVRLAFMNAFVKVRISHEYNSWDEAFGSPHQKNEKLVAKRAEFLKRAKVWFRVAELRRETPRRNVFPQVAKEFGISVGLARDYFYAANKLTRAGNSATMLAELEQILAAIMPAAREQTVAATNSRLQSFQNDRTELEQIAAAINVKVAAQNKRMAAINEGVATSNKRLQSLQNQSLQNETELEQQVAAQNEQAVALNEQTVVLNEQAAALSESVQSLLKGKTGAEIRAETEQMRAALNESSTKSPK